MQGKNILSPLAVRALLASAALFTGVSIVPIRATTPKQIDQREETIITKARNIIRSSNDGIIFPHPLNTVDEQRIRYIFDLQRKGDFTTAQSETIQISDNLLLGDILAERYLNPQFTPNAGQLKLWLKNFTSYTDAFDIQKRLNRLTTIKISIPITSNLSIKNQNSTTNYLQSLDQLNFETKPFKRNNLLDRAVHERSAMGIEGVRSALQLIQQTHGINALYAEQLQAEIAQKLFTLNHLDYAYKLAKKAFQSSNHCIGLAGYIAGLIAWKKGKINKALMYFSQSTNADIITTNIRAGSYFWSARSNLKLGNQNEYIIWLKRSASFIHTFYGILANQILKEEKIHSITTTHNHLKSFLQLINFSSDLKLSQIDVNAIEATLDGKRFFALLQVGEQERAKTVLKQIWLKNSKNLALLCSIQAMSKFVGFNDISKKMMDTIEKNYNLIDHNKSLPLPKLHPKNGYKINPALLYALIRLESNFNNKAVSNNGARGLMQIMPMTAKYIAKKQNNIALHHPDELQNSGLNLEIGQLYLIHLAELYKNYLQKALTYLWIYSDKLDLPSPSLKTLAKNKWPKFINELKLAQAITVH